MTMGEVSGIREHHMAKGPSGLLILNMPAYKEKIMRMTIGVMNWEESLCSLMDAPIAAKKEANKRYPPRKYEHGKNFPKIDSLHDLHNL